MITEETNRDAKYWLEEVEKGLSRALNTDDAKWKYKCFKWLEVHIDELIDNALNSNKIKMTQEDFDTLKSAQKITEEWLENVDNYVTIKNESSRRRKAQRAVLGDNMRSFSNNIVIMTASNPNASPLPTRHNEELNEQLEKDIRRWKFVKVKGKYGNVERSFFIYDMPLGKAKELADKYQQESFIYGFWDGEEFVWCFYGKNGDRYEKADETVDVQDVTDEDDCYTQLCKRFKFKIAFPSFEKLRREEKEPVNFILSKKDLAYYESRVNDPSITPKGRMIAKALLKSHYRSLKERSE